MHAYLNPAKPKAHGLDLPLTVPSLLPSDNFEPHALPSPELTPLMHTCRGQVESRIAGSAK
jgi:hypothetical protein